MASKSDLITRVRQDVGALVNITRKLNHDIDEFVVLDYATTLTDEDFIGENVGLVKADLVAVKAFIDAYNALLAANSKAHLRALYVVKA